ncbi:ParA family protein [Pseudonocardia sp. D17]|uniref:ParA family protein n=1 Tax=Pseudonocardia sp. D17 TaxID=882661 RepID=UPI002B3C1ACB|nr:cobyrinic acid a,c-diamide synthase [Pseudonocardia sp. D17]
MAQDIVAFINFKGGTTKTTSAVFTAHVLHELGRRVLYVDSDPQGSALSWNEDAPQPFPFTVIGLPTKALHNELRDFAAGYDAVVIDTPPLEQKSGVVVSALRVATLAVVPVAPTPIEYKRLALAVETVNDVADLRADGQPPPLAVLLTRTIPNAISTSTYRDQITNDGLLVIGSTVGRLEIFSQADGDNITNATATAYGDAVAELQHRGLIK